MVEQQRAEQRHKASVGDPASVIHDTDDVKIHSVMAQVLSTVQEKIHLNAIRNIFLCMGTGEEHPFTFPQPPQMIQRLQHNFQFFLVNYVLLLLVVLFCVLIFHPWSLLSCLATSGAWIAFTMQRKHLQQMYTTGIKEEHVIYGMLGATVIVFAFFLLPSLLIAAGVAGVLGGLHAFFRETLRTKIIRQSSSATEEEGDHQV